MMGHQQSIGLDISNRAARFVELQNSKRGPVIKHSKQVEIPEGIIEDGIIRETRKVAELLKTLFRGRGLNEREVVVSLPERQCFVKTISVHQNSHPVDDRVLKEIQDDLPFALDEVVYDWQVMRHIQSGMTNSFSVIFVASPKTIISAYEEVLQNANLLPIALEVESVALTRALVSWEKPSQNILLVDSGRSVTSFVTVCDESIQLTMGTQKFSGEMCTQEISKTESLSREEAEKKKMSTGISESGTQSCTKSLKELDSIIQTVLSYQESRSSGHQPIEHVLLAGGSAHMPGLREYIAKRTEKDVNIADPFVNLAKPEKKAAPMEADDPNKRKFLSYTTAIGLALRPFHEER